MTDHARDPATGSLDDSPFDAAWPHPDTHDDSTLAEGGTHLLDLVAGVDHLNRGPRPGLTIYDALNEALHWWLTDHTDQTGHHDTDSLDGHLDQLLHHLAQDPAATAATVLDRAIRRWVITMAATYNAGYHWPHPAPRRAFPPTVISP